VNGFEVRKFGKKKVLRLAEREMREWAKQ